MAANDIINFDVDVDFSFDDSASPPYENSQWDSEVTLVNPCTNEFKGYEDLATWWGDFGPCEHNASGIYDTHLLITDAANPSGLTGGTWATVCGAPTLENVDPFSIDEWGTDNKADRLQSVLHEVGHSLMWGYVQDGELLDHHNSGMSEENPDTGTLHRTPFMPYGPKDSAWLWDKYGYRGINDCDDYYYDPQDDAFRMSYSDCASNAIQNNN